MPPAGLLAIIAAGLVLAYVLPQRIRERSDYALVRTEERYSADMRVVRASAARVAPADASSASAEIPLLVTGQARARVAQLGAQRMSRPRGPLERAAVHAQRESLHLRQDRAASVRRREALARRRAASAGVAGTIAVALWITVAWTAVPAVVAAIATGAFVSVLAFSARAAAAERASLAQIRRVVREVEAAATATRALTVVAAHKANGLEAEPSDVATQAIRIVTAVDLAPLSAPELPRVREQRAAQAAALEQAIERAQSAQEEREADVAAGWRPKTMPVPTYALKPSVRQQVARELSEEDYAASSHAHSRVASEAARAERAEAAPTSSALETILARRKRA